MEGRGGKGVAGGPALPQSAIKERRKSGAPCARKHNKRKTTQKRFVAVTQVANMDFPLFVSQLAHVLLILLINRSAASFATSRRSKRRSFVSDQL